MNMVYIDRLSLRALRRLADEIRSGRLFVQTQRVGKRLAATAVSRPLNEEEFLQTIAEDRRAEPE